MQPLAERVRPNSLEQYIGQEQIIGQNAALRKAIEQNLLPSIIMNLSTYSNKVSNLISKISFSPQKPKQSKIFITIKYILLSIV